MIYKTHSLPPLAPPGIVYPIAWTGLYLLMGISAYRIYESNRPACRCALTLFGIQLAINLLGSPIFFRLEVFLFALIWLCVMWVLIVAMIISFHKINRFASYLQIPYLLWITFAGYLNLGIFS